MDSMSYLTTMKGSGASQSNGTLGGLVGASPNPADEAAGARNNATGTRGLWRHVAAGAPKDRPLIPIGTIVMRSLARLRRILGSGVMHASAPLRNRSEEP